VTRVLVVEDEESFSDALSYMLRKEGFEVAVCPTGPDAIETFDRTGADLVLLDLMLPGLPGSEVCRSLRERSNVPVIMLTAKDSEIDKVVGLELGADDYLTKPFSPRELVARVRAVLRRSEGRHVDGDLLRVADLVLDVPRMSVRRGDQPIDLTPTEFQLLAALARHPGRVLTRAQLLDAARGADTEAYDRAIDSHVKNIRRKLEPDPHAPRYLETVYGIGYRLVDE
jgi:two-component system, OmpR family, response regulator RegX3